MSSGGGGSVSKKEVERMKRRWKGWAQVEAEGNELRWRRKELGNHRQAHVEAEDQKERVSVEVEAREHLEKCF